MTKNLSPTTQQLYKELNNDLKLIINTVDNNEQKKQMIHNFAGPQNNKSEDFHKLLEFLKLRTHIFVGYNEFPLQPFYGLDITCDETKCTSIIKKEQIIEDGNCLFDSLAYLTGDKRKLTDIRSEVADYYVEITGNKTLEDVPIKVYKSGKRNAGDQTINAYCELENKSVVVFNLDIKDIGVDLYITSNDFLFLLLKDKHYTPLISLGDKHFFLKKLNEINKLMDSVGVQIDDGFNVKSRQVSFDAFAKIFGPKLISPSYNPKNNGTRVNVRGLTRAVSLNKPPRSGSRSRRGTRRPFRLGSLFNKHIPRLFASTRRRRN